MPPLKSSAPKKRNLEPGTTLPNTHRSAKRAKTADARTILTQHSDKALNKNGDLDVATFVKAREFEIKAMGSQKSSEENCKSQCEESAKEIEGEGGEGGALIELAYGQAPEDGSLLSQSSWVKMKDDNTPTVISRRRKLTPHQRLRLDRVEELKRLGALTKRKRNRCKEQKPGETDPEKMVSIAPRIPKLKMDTLSKPAKPPAKFRKRQIHKSWLPTHLYHAKRAHMTSPKEPLWRFAIPLTPTEKCYRLTHRATTSRGCVAWDMSYMATIGVEGVEGSLLGLLNSIGVDANMLVGKREEKWRRGTRWWEGWIRERDGEKRSIAKVAILRDLDAAASEVSEHKNQGKKVPKGQELNDKSDVGLQQDGAVRVPLIKSKLKEPRRKLLIRVHPSAFFQTWNEVVKVAKIQRPAAMVEDLRFEIGSIEVIGPESTQALIGVLHPVKSSPLPAKSMTIEDQEFEWADIETPEQIWPQLVGVTNPASLPANVILGFNICDPRLHHPPKTVQPPGTGSSDNALLDLISSWPPDQTQTASDLFDHTKRLGASRQLSSQKAINRRKGEALPGGYPTPSPKDPKIPLVLMASRTTDTAQQGSWTLLLPWSCVLPVWYSLMHYPLASGGNPLFGGLQQKRQVSFEQGVPWYPADYPGTKAGFEWELLERERQKQEWEKRPRGKRTAWGSVDLGGGKKGETGLGWACDWERLFQGPPLPDAGGNDKETHAQATKSMKVNTAQQPTPAHAAPIVASLEEPGRQTSKPPLAIHHLISPLSATPPFPPTALSPVHLTLLRSGHPLRNARLYRLPSTDTDLRAKWLSLVNPSKSFNQSRPSRAVPDPPMIAAPHIRAQSLATNLLSPPLSSLNAELAPPKAGNPSYPRVPDENDLIGFVTAGNYNLGEGKCEAIGNVAVARVTGKDEKGKSSEKSLCIVRDAGQSIGRLARWKFV